MIQSLNGDKPYEGGDMRTLPGTNVVGYGRIAEFDADFNLVREFEPDLSPSLTGFHGITHTCIQQRRGDTIHPLVNRIFGFGGCVCPGFSPHVDSSHIRLQA